MFGSSILEVAIGLIFVYLLMSLICSAANEIIESLLKNRATDLERGIKELFGPGGNTRGDNMVEQFYKHPLISGLFEGGYGGKTRKPNLVSDYLWPTNLPTYVPARNFAYAVIDLVLHPGSGSGTAGNVGTFAYGNSVTMEALRHAIDNVDQPQVRGALRALAGQSGDDVNAMRENLEAWFNSSMDRVSGWYKRRTKWIILVLGFTLTVLLNVNTITISRTLSADATLRNLVVAQAEAAAGRGQAPADFEKNRRELEGLGLPIGWPSGIDFINPLVNQKYNTWDHVLLPILGWLLTAAAISLGAPFWFDILNKVMVIRSTVKPHEKSQEEASEDRQGQASQAPTSPRPAGAPAPASSAEAAVAFQPQEWSEGNPQEGIV